MIPDPTHQAAHAATRPDAPPTPARPASPAEAEAAAGSRVLHSLGRVVRGLSALFWGLPLALLVCARTSVQDFMRPLGMLPAVLVMGLLLHGLVQLGHFQPQERVWIHAVDRTKFVACINLGLAPFLHWWNLMPQVAYYAYAVLLLVVSGLLFLMNLNLMLERLAAMLPDETLRGETQFFTRINRALLLGLLTLMILFTATNQPAALPPAFAHIRFVLEASREWIVITFILLPVALTMTLLWKTKETILSSIFSNPPS